MEALAETKLLNFNLEKSCFIVIGNKKTRKEIEEKEQEHPIYLCGTKMKQEEQAKYLGDWLSAFGLADSVAFTVKKRKGLVVHSIHEIRAVVDDSRSRRLAWTSGRWPSCLCCCTILSAGKISPHKLSRNWKTYKDNSTGVSLLWVQDAPSHVFTGRQRG